LIGGSIFLIVICLFFPHLDQDKIERRRVELDAATRDYQRRRDKASDTEKTKINDKWKDEEKQLNDDITKARESARSWYYWYDWGMMWGFLLLAFGSLACLGPQYPPTRRVIAAILLCSLLLLVLVRFTGGVRVTAGAGGPPP